MNLLTSGVEMNAQVKGRGPLPGEWVLLKGREIVAHNSNGAEIMRAAATFPHGDVVVSRIPKSKYCFY